MILDQSYSNRVALVRASDSIYESVKKAFELAGPPTLKKGGAVAIKLNLCLFRPYETGATTDPRVLEAVVQYLRSLSEDLDIVLVESDATSARADLLFKWLGFSALSERLAVRTVNLSNDKRLKITLPSHCYLEELWMPKTLLEASCIISLAKLKTHGFTKITCALKNMFGSIPYRGKSKWHPIISKIIADANVAIKPDFSLVDGIIAMEGVDAPIMGIPRLMNLLVAGRDPVAVDSVCARIMGFDSNEIDHIKEAEKREVGTQSYQIVGEDISSVAERFEYSRFYYLVNQVVNKIRGSI